MNYEKRIELCSPELCTGCMACYNACPFDAINIVIDKYGFSIPVITSQCKGCSACNTVCPVFNPVKSRNPQICYAATSKIVFPKTPTSGGIASLLYKNIIKAGGIGYGVVFNKNIGRFVFKRAHGEAEAIEFSGSKYIQADVEFIYKSIKDDLHANNRVIFVGTPCQIAGLKSYLQKEYENLLLVDIVCHGVPSQKMFFNSLHLKGSDYIDKVSFRDGKRYVLDYLLNDSRAIRVDSYHSKFYEAFSLGKSIRQSCHDCKYASSKRVGDITIGDFWGIGSDSRLYNTQKSHGGISMVLLNNEKGIHYP